MEVFVSIQAGGKFEGCAVTDGEVFRCEKAANDVRGISKGFWIHR